jgi:polysaccharide pyruvyl transferase WcaK-like protein
MTVSLRQRVARVLDPDRALQAAMGSFVEAAGIKYALAADPERWRPGKPLKLLLAGYSGTRNTGSDARVEEMIRQFRVIFGDEQLELSVLTQDPALTAGYFRTARQLHMPQLFPKFVAQEASKRHGVIACEGSMFKSKFAAALSTMMAGALGVANTEGKVSVGYGADADNMNTALRDFVRKQCRDSLVICRNEHSRSVLESLGIRTKGGADTAWTFEPPAADLGAEMLREQGWDGRQKVLAVCPINPFWWPVKPDLVKAVAHRWGGQYRDEHHQSIYFHEWSDEAAKKYAHYLDGFAHAVKVFAAERRVMVVLFASEQLDRRSCEALAERLPGRPPVFGSDVYDMYEMVSLLRHCSYVVSSRFHAIVLSMPALIPSAGVTMDERIRNVMHDRGHDSLSLEVDDPDLGDKLLEILRRLERERESIAEQIARFIPTQLKRMGQMGIDLEDEVLRIYPEFPLRQVKRSWENYLPPLSPAIERLMEGRI